MTALADADPASSSRPTDGGRGGRSDDAIFTSPPVHQQSLHPGAHLGLSSVFEVTDEVGDIIVGVVGLGGRGVLLGIGSIDLLQIFKVVRAQLGDDAGEQFLQRLGLGIAADDVGVGGDRGLDYDRGNWSHKFSARAAGARALTKLYIETGRHRKRGQPHSYIRF